MFEDNYGIIDESYSYQITITFSISLLILADILSANNIFLVIFVADIQFVRQQSAKMNRLTEVVAVNADSADMFLDKYFVALHVFVNPLCQPANQPQ